MVREYYALPGNLCGGSLHVVLDDGNINDDDVAFGLESAMKRGDVPGERLAEVLARMTMTQRRKVYATFWISA